MSANLNPNLFYDEENDTISYSWDVNHNDISPTWYYSNYSLYVDIPDAVDGEYTLTIIATDQWSDTNSAQTTIPFKVYQNQVPTTTETFPNVTKLSYHMYTRTLDDSKFSDGNNEAIDIILTTNASWITIHQSNFTFTGTPTDSNLGNWSLSATARDPSDAEVTITGYVEVTQNSLPRQIPSVVIPEPVEIQMLSFFSFNFSEYFEEPDGEEYTIERVSPANYTTLVIDNSTKIMSGNERTNIGSEETITFTFIFRDATRPDSFQTDIKFLAKPNKSPYLSGTIVTRDWYEGVEWTWDVASEFTDDEGNTISYELVNSTSNTFTLNETTSTFLGTPTVDDETNSPITIIFRVRDNQYPETEYSANI